MRNLTVALLLACLALTTASIAAEWGDDGRIILALYAWDGEGATAPAGAPQVGTVALSWCPNGELAVQTTVDDGAACLTYQVYAEIDGKWHSEDLVLLATNIDRRGQACTSLTLADYAAGADSFFLKVVVKPIKEKAGCTYATAVERIPIPGKRVVAPYCPRHPDATPQNPCECYTRKVITPAPQAQAVVQQPVTAPVITYTPAPAPPADIICAREFRLVDEYNTARGSMAVNALGQPEIALWDAQQQPRVVIGLQQDGSPQLDLLGAGGRARLGLAVLPDGSISIAMTDESGQYRAILGLERDGSPSIQLVDEDQTARAELSLDRDGAPALVLMDRNGYERATVQLDRDGNPLLDLVGPTPKRSFRKP